MLVFCIELSISLVVDASIPTGCKRVDPPAIAHGSLEDLSYKPPCRSGIFLSAMGVDTGNLSLTGYIIWHFIPMISSWSSHSSRVDHQWWLMKSTMTFNKPAAVNSMPYDIPLNLRSDLNPHWITHEFKFKPHNNIPLKSIKSPLNHH